MVARATFKNLLNMAVLKERLNKTDLEKGRLNVLSYVPMYIYYTSVKVLEQSNIFSSIWFSSA